MGKTRQCKYRVEQKVYYPSKEIGETGTLEHQQWGLDRLPKMQFVDYLRDVAESCKEGGVNEHIGKMLGFIPYPTAAKIVRQSDGKVMREWKAATFQVW